MHSILIVDDEDFILNALSRVFRAEPYTLTLVNDPLEALEICKQQKFELIISDQRMPELNGIDLLRTIQDIQPCPKIIISGHADFKDVVAGFNEGVVQRFINKPWDNYALKKEVSDLLDDPHPHQEAVTPATENDGQEPVNFHGIFTTDSEVLKQIEFIRQVAGSGTSAPFFINGETGTGKEMVAKAIHCESRRNEKPFIALNCANLSEALLESQLFGHVKGAFTGAQSDKKGLFEEADGGTVFLDEIVELPLILQAKLLRVLQEKEFTRLGENIPRKFDVQIISASALSLKKAVEQGKFRADLRYRLDIMRILLPPLRERPEDIILLFRLFLQKQLADLSITEIEVEDEVISFLCEYPWPGNIRELQNSCIYMAAILPANNGVITKLTLPPELTEFFDNRCDDHHVAKENILTREMVESVLAENKGNKSAAARQLGISRMTLWRKLKDDETNSIEIPLSVDFQI